MTATVRRRPVWAPTTALSLVEDYFVVAGPLGQVSGPRTGLADLRSTLVRDVGLTTRLWRQGLLSTCVYVQGEPRYVLHPRLRPQPRPVATPDVTLDRRAHVTAGPRWRGTVRPGAQRDRSRWWVYAPTAWADVELIDEALLGEVRALAAGQPGRGDAAGAAIRDDLHWAGIAHRAGSDPVPDWWDDAALAMHTGLLAYGEDHRVGARPADENDLIPDADVDAVIGGRGHRVPRATEPTFDGVVASRRSARSFGSPCVSTVDVESLVASVMCPRKDGRRTFPGAGDARELELVVTVGSADGVAPGLYRVDARDGHLVPVVLTATDPRPELILRAAGDAMRSGPPPVLISVVVDLGRIMVDYDTIGYGLALRDTGVLLAHLHLTATRLSLGSCIIGAGRSRLLADLLGHDPVRVACLGDLALGPLP